MLIYMSISRDKYELPVCAADSIEELAEQCGVKVQSIRSYLSHTKKNGKRCKYVIVEVED